MNSKTCRHARREIDELEIGQPLGEGTASHLSECAACAQFQSERASLRELIGGLGSVAAPADFDMRLRARIARERSGPETQPFFARFIGMPAIAAAAVIVMVVGTVVWIGQRNADQTGTIATRQSPATPPSNEVVTGTTSQDARPAAADSDAGPARELVAYTGSRKNRKPARSGSSTDYGLSAANRVGANDSFVNAPSKPVVVSLEDDTGAKRKISLPPVSFGAQSLVDNRVNASYTGNSRVW